MTVRLQLRYRRRPKPRGGWRWPLEVIWRLVDEAGQVLEGDGDLAIAVTIPWPRPAPDNPDVANRLDETVPEWSRAGLLAWIRGPWSRHLLLDSHTVTFRTREEREEFVGWLHDAHAHVSQALAAWLDENRGDPGDAEDCVVEAPLTGAAGPAQATARRVIRLRGGA